MMLLEGYPFRENPRGETRYNELGYLYGAVALLGLLNTPIPGVEPLEIQQDFVAGPRELVRLLQARFSDHLPKLTAIGIDEPLDYFEVYMAAFRGDTNKVRYVADKTRNRLISLHKSEYSKMDITLADSQREGLVEKKLEGMEPPENQRVTIIVAPYAGGKTELHKVLGFDPRTTLSSDLDTIRPKLLEGYDPNNQEHIMRTQVESWEVSKRLGIIALGRGYSEVIETSLHRIDRWLEDPIILTAREKQIPIYLELLLRPFTDCLTHPPYIGHSV